MKKITIIAATILIIAGCSNDKYNKLYPLSTTTTTCDTTAISYTNDIAPIIEANCYSPGNGCHDAIGAATSGYNYTTYSGLEREATQAALINDINWTPTSGDEDMPKNGAKLSACDINKITRWVNEGAPDN